MAKWTILKSAIASVIKTNGNQEITGALLQNTLNNIVNTVGENATFAGVAIPTTNPGVPDGPVFYLASESGVYSNFNGINLDGTCFVALVYENSSWLKKEIGASINAILDKQNKIPQSKLYNSIYAIDYIIENSDGLQFVEKSEGIIVILRDGGYIYQLINNEFISIGAADETTLYLLKNPSSLSGYNKFSILILNEYTSEMDVYASLDDIAKIRKELGTKPENITTAFEQINLNLNNINLIKTKLKKQYNLIKIEALSKLSPSEAIKDALTAVNDNKASFPTIADELADYSGVKKIPVIRQLINSTDNIFNFSYVDIEHGVIKTFEFAGAIYSDLIRLSKIETKTIAYSSDLYKIKQDYKQADTALQTNIDALKATATDKKNGLMSKSDKATLDALPTQLTAEQTAREQADTAINGEIQGINDKGTLHDLFRACGAVWNDTNQRYILNGLELTTDEMVMCYIVSANIWQADNYASIFNSTKLKTTIKAFALKNFNKNISADNMFAFSSIVVADLWYINRKHRCLISDGSEMFKRCTYLTSVYGLDAKNCKSFMYAFVGCSKLKDIDIINLQVNISFNDSPLLSKESIVHLISNATPSSPITITLHPTAYAMATADPEIQAELEKQPNISLAEGEPSA